MRGPMAPFTPSELPANPVRPGPLPPQLPLLQPGPLCGHGARRDRLGSCEGLLVGGDYLHNRMDVFYFGQED
jgi:hypothetical protein